MYDILVIGGGASGIMAAIAAKEENIMLSVAVAERNNRVGKKILTTGNGRCNITNKNIDIKRYHGKNIYFADFSLSVMDLDKTLDFFKKLGMYPKFEEDKVYPYSLQASSVVDILRMKMAEYSIAEICDFKCCDIKKENEIFIISSSDGKKIKAKRVIVCCGGKASPKCGTDGNAYKLLQKFGHKCTDLYPSLVQLRSDSPHLVPMKGVKNDSLISIYVDNELIKSEYGELLFTDYGLSGPPVFQLSRIASKACTENKKVFVTVDLMPDVDFEELVNVLKSRNKYVPVAEFLTGMINKLVGRQILKSSGIQKFNTDSQIISDDIIINIANNIKYWRFNITGTNFWDMSQVTAGGIDTDDFDSKTMESRLAVGLYAAGEILDVDGDCGGFNLQWAWSSGYVAGRSAAKSLE